LVEHTPEHPHGTLVPHKGMHLLERLISLEWTLIQQHDGLIYGTNNWISYDEKGKKALEGSEPFFGV
jgi:hypothetical protein